MVAERHPKTADVDDEKIEVMSVSGTGSLNTVSSSIGKSISDSGFTAGSTDGWFAAKSAGIASAYAAH